eukprot:gene8456-10387_t
MFSLMLGYLYHISTRNPLNRKTPKIVFMWFYIIYLVCNVIALIGVFGFCLFSLQFFNSLSLNFELYLFYGLYFGVLGRDFADLCSDRIANILGLGGSRLPFTKISDSYCAICTSNLKPSMGGNQNVLNLKLSDLAPQSVGSGGDNKLSEKLKQLENKLDWFMNIIFSTKPYTLPCNHVFHEWCIRGWALVGKKNMCPHCNEKVDLRSLCENPWQKTSLLWSFLLDTIRFGLVWNPLILVLLQGIVWVVDR